MYDSLSFYYMTDVFQCIKSSIMQQPLVQHSIQFLISRLAIPITEAVKPNENEEYEDLKNLLSAFIYFVEMQHIAAELLNILIGYYPAKISSF